MNMLRPLQVMDKSLWISVIWVQSKYNHIIDNLKGLPWKLGTGAGTGIRNDDVR